jgi:hypothetical protein
MPIKVSPAERKTAPVVLPSIPVAEKTTRTIREFCARNNLSVSMFYKLRAAGKTPRLIYIGAKPLITDAAEKAWLHDLEAEATQTAA